ASIVVRERAGYRVDDRDAVGASIACHQGHRPDVREHRRELGDQGATCTPSTAAEDVTHALRVGAELHAACAGVGTGEVQLIGRDAIEAVETIDDVRVFVQLESDD